MLMGVVARLEMAAPDKSILNALAWFANDEGEAWPSNKTLAIYTGHNLRTVQRSLVSLRSRELLDITGDNDGRSRTLRLRLDRLVPAENGGDRLPGGMTVCQGGDDCLPGGVTVCHGGGMTVCQGGDDCLPGGDDCLPCLSKEGTTLNDRENNKIFPSTDVDAVGDAVFVQAALPLAEPPKPPPAPAPPAALLAADPFDAFWAAYPRKVGKLAARKAWAKALTTAPAARILADLRRHQFHADPQYRPHPATWLNQGRWMDEKPTEPKDEARKSTGHYNIRTGGV